MSVTAWRRRSLTWRARAYLWRLCMIGFRLIVRCVKGRKSFRNALDSVACSKVILLASGTRFAYRTTVVTILLRCCFSLAFMRKMLDSGVPWGVRNICNLNKVSLCRLVCGTRERERASWVWIRSFGFIGSAWLTHVRTPYLHDRVLIHAGHA